LTFQFQHFTDPETNNLVLQVDDPFEIRDLIPESRIIVHDEWNVSIRWTDENVHILRTHGYAVPRPEHDWPGVYKPYQHQLEMIYHRLVHKRCFDLSEQGVGKTAPSLWAADLLMKRNKVRKALILAPLSTLESVWQQDLYKVLMHRTCAIIHGTREQRERALHSSAEFYILNHDGIKIKWLRAALRKRKDIDLIIIDEIGMFRDPSTNKFKDLEKLIQPHQRIWGATGTPCPNAPTDAWAQCRLINPDGVPQFFGTWKADTMIKLTPFKWAPKRGAQKLVHTAMQPAIRFMKRDCIDLPELLPPINLKAELTVEQTKAFIAMQARQRAQIGDHEITAVHAADELGKLRQILCGVCKDTETGEYLDLGFGPRLKVLREAIEGAAAKALVIVPFKGVINRLAEEVARFTTCAVLNGDVSIGRRNTIIRDFKNTDNPHVLLCHPRVMAHGLNLTEADRTIFYAPIFSNDDFEQVIERFNRAGQKNVMSIIRIGAHALDWEIYRTIDERRLNQKSILDLYLKVLDLTVS
jgi:hypothetical protein